MTTILVQLTVALPLLLQAQAQVLELNDMSALIAAQVQTELALHFSDVPSQQVHPAEIELTPVSRLGELSLWRGSVSSIDHWHWYLVGAKDSQLLRLGGFESPELIEALTATGLGVDPRRPSSLRMAGQLLAKMADPEGAVEVVFPGGEESQHDSKVIVQKWEGMRPHRWPADTIFHMPGDAAEVRITALSFRTRAMTPVWVPIQYVFLFSARGDLVAWSSRFGEPFAIRQTN